MADLTTTLLGCQNPDPAVRTRAEKALADAECNNFPAFTLALVNELGTEGKELTVRQLAGIHFKNLLVAKDETRQVEKHDKWKKMDPTARSSLKNILLNTIRSPETVARHTAAQACSEVAAVEIPYNEWPEFLTTLMENVTSTQQPDPVKISTLECLGFTCERIATLDNAPGIAPETTDRMLTTIVDGIRTDRPNPIRLAAATALRNSLLFTRKNMENVTERNMIMQTICEATQSQDVNVRAAAYECIVKIACQYYDKLQEYMQTLFQLTYTTIKNDEETVALQAIEFWSTLCEEEMELLDEAQEYAERGVAVEPGRECVRYVSGALEHLGPLLIEILTKQDEDAALDEETWNLSMAGATCLSLVANTVENSIVPVVMPFVQKHIKSDNWRFREAGTMAFGSILEGPSVEAIGPYVNQSIPVLLQALSDHHVMVKDTTAWTIGRICELHAKCIPGETFPTLVNGLMAKLLNETPRVSSQACFALHNLAAAVSGDTRTKTLGTNALTPYMHSLLQTLVQVGDREDAHENNLRLASFEAVSVLIQNSAPDCKHLLIQLLPLVIARLKVTFSISVLTNEEKERKEGVQGLLCGLIQVISLKLTKDDIMPFADDIMCNLLQVLQTKNATSHEEAFSATSAICDQLESEFEKYMDALAPFMMMGLNNFEAYHVCVIAVGLVGDIARNIETKIQPYCDEIMTALINSLQNTTLHRSVKPPVLSCFGDIAMAIGIKYEPYIQISLMMLLQASQTRAPEHDEELIEYVNQLREGILEAYTGIIQGLKDGKRVELLLPYNEAIMDFLEMLSNDENRDYEVMSKAAGLIGDIASSLGPSVRQYLEKPFIEKLLKEAYSSGDESVMETCNWAKSEVQTLLRAVPAI